MYIYIKVENIVFFLTDMQLFSECGEVDFTNLYFDTFRLFDKTILSFNITFIIITYMYILYSYIYGLFDYLNCYLDIVYVCLTKKCYLISSCWYFTRNALLTMKMAASFFFILSCEKWQLALYIYVWMNFDMHDRMIRLKKVYTNVRITLLRIEIM